MTLPPMTPSGNNFEDLVHQYTDNALRWQRFMVEARSTKDETDKRARLLAAREHQHQERAELLDGYRRALVRVSDSRERIRRAHTRSKRTIYVLAGGFGGSLAALIAVIVSG